MQILFLPLFGFVQTLDYVVAVNLADMGANNAIKLPRLWRYVPSDTGLFDIGRKSVEVHAMALNFALVVGDVAWRIDGRIIRVALIWSI